MVVKRAVEVKCHPLLFVIIALFVGNAFVCVVFTLSSSPFSEGCGGAFLSFFVVRVVVSAVLSSCSSFAGRTRPVFVLFGLCLPESVPHRDSIGYDRPSPGPPQAVCSSARRSFRVVRGLGRAFLYLYLYLYL